MNDKTCGVGSSLLLTLGLIQMFVAIAPVANRFDKNPANMMTMGSFVQPNTFHLTTNCLPFYLKQLVSIVLVRDELSPGKYESKVHLWRLLPGLQSGFEPVEEPDRS